MGRDLKAGKQRFSLNNLKKTVLSFAVKHIQTSDYISGVIENLTEGKQLFAQHQEHGFTTRPMQMPPEESEKLTLRQRIFLLFLPLLF